MDLKAVKFYIRHREGYPETEVLDYARRGFWLLGVETTPFESTFDIESLHDLSPLTGLAGYIEDIHTALTKLNKPIPKPHDYPEELSEFFGRKIRKDKLGNVRNLTESYFIKPISHKLFNGMVWNNDSFSRRLIVTQPDDLDVWVSDYVNFVSEYRVFVLDGRILDCRNYRGDWSKAPNKEIIEAGVKVIGKNPIAYCIDWGVLDNGKTVLVEMNDGFSFGHYGLNPVYCAHMLSARWHELTTTP